MSFTLGFDISALDTSFKQHAHRGIGRYVKELKKFFEATHAHERSVQVQTFDYRSLAAYGSSGLRVASSLVEHLPLGKTTLRQQLLFPFQLSEAHHINKQNGDSKNGSGNWKKFDAVHFPAHMDAPAWGMNPYVLTVLDLIPLVCADLYRSQKGGWRFHFARWLELRAIQNASLILAISENTARDVERILHVPPERIVVTPLGVDQKFFRAELRESQEALLARYQVGPLEGSECPLLLYVGGIDPRKNYPFLLEVFQALKAKALRNQKPVPRLLMAGNIQADKEFSKLQALIAQLDLSKEVHLLGYVPDEDLLQLYAAASVFFFPSLYEGFGLPLLEAMAAGAPVVSSNTSAMPEVLGGAGILVNPRDTESAVRAIDSIITNPDYAGRLREEGQRRARLFTWDRTGQATLEAYKVLLTRVSRHAHNLVRK